MKINSPIFKDKDAKDAVTYPESKVGFNSILMCRVQGSHPHTLCIRSMQGYPVELVRNSGMDITLDDVLTILDERYNNQRHLMH